MTPDEVTLREYIERIVLELEKRIEGQDRSVDERLRTIYEKLSGMNELKDVIAAQSATFVPREVFEEMRSRCEHLASRDQLDDLRSRVDKCATQEALEATLKTRETRFTAGETRMTKIEDWKNFMEGKQAVRQWLWPIIVGIVVFIFTQMMRILFPILPNRP